MRAAGKLHQRLRRASCTRGYGAGGRGSEGKRTGGGQAVDGAAWADAEELGNVLAVAG